MKKRVVLKMAEAIESLATEFTRCIWLPPDVAADLSGLFRESFEVVSNG